MEEVLPDDYEKRFVHDVYDNIAKQFDQTRYKVWESVQEFLKVYLIEIEDAKVLEVGCGNGKNLVYINENFEGVDVIGCDMCDKFVDITKQNGVKCVKGDVLNLPFENESFDIVLSVAVIHHLSTEERRRKSVQEMFRLLKPGGYLFIQVWAFEQPKESKRQFEGTQDQLVGWNNEHDRYYHLFKEDELENLVEDSLRSYPCSLEGAFYEKGNWVVILQNND